MIEALVTGLVVGVMAWVMTVQFVAGLYGWRVARKHGAQKWEALQEACAMATGNAYIFHKCDADGGRR